MYLLFSGKLDSSYWTLETELTNALETQVVPQEYLIHREFRPLTASDKCKYIGSKHHLHNSYAAVEFYSIQNMSNNLLKGNHEQIITREAPTSLVRVLEREAIEDLEAVFCATCKAPIVLIERSVHY